MPQIQKRFHINITFDSLLVDDDLTVRNRSHITLTEAKTGPFKTHFWRRKVSWVDPLIPLTLLKLLL